MKKCGHRRARVIANQKVFLRKSSLKVEAVEGEQVWWCPVCGAYAFSQGHRPPGTDYVLPVPEAKK